MPGILRNLYTGKPALEMDCTSGYVVCADRNIHGTCLFDIAAANTNRHTELPSLTGHDIGTVNIPRGATVDHGVDAKVTFESYPIGAFTVEVYTDSEAPDGDSLMEVATSLWQVMNGRLGIDKQSMVTTLAIGATPRQLTWHSTVDNSGIIATRQQ